MEYGRVPDLDKDVSRIVQGLTMVSVDRLDEAFELLDAVYAAGINTFDGAHVYGGGKCERAFGRWVAKRGLRDQVVILDKGCHPSGGRKRVTPDDLAADLDQCLERLGFDRIDMFALHRDDRSVDVGEIICALNEHVQAGKVRTIGASNWTHQRIAEANAYAEANGLAGFAFSSPNYGLAECYEDPWGETVTITGRANLPARQWYEKTGMAVFAWSSLAGGFFSGRFSRDNLDALTDDADKRCIRCFCREDNFRRLDRASELAAERNASIAQIALAYLLSGPLEVFALMAAHTPDQARANAQAANIKLTEPEIAWLDLRSDAR